MPIPSQHEVTRLLMAWREGQEQALQQLIPLVQRELRQVAHRYMKRESPGHTLQTTALVNEAYIRMVDCQRVNWQNRAHFIAVAAQLMRRILVDLARSRAYQKRGGGAQRITLDDALAAPRQPPADLLALNEALEALAVLDSRKSQVVEMRFFGGMSVQETAEVLKVSADTVLRDWRLAKAWLLRELAGKEAE